MKINRFNNYALAMSLLCNSALQAADLIVLNDFEAANYGKGKASGNAFGSGPAQGTLPGQMNVDGFKGQALVNSFKGGDRARKVDHRIGR